VDEAERTIALARLREADAACLRVQIELTELDAIIASAAGDPPALASWYARRAELLQLASEHAAHAAALYAALYVRDGT
jgi:hypothetical protein